MLTNERSYTIIYLHGFQSSSRSQKAQALQQFLERKPELAHISCFSPDLPFSPEQTLTCIKRLMAEKQRPVFMGSSMGGFYAAWASQLFNCPAVLINPVAFAESIFEGLIDQQIENIYTGEKHLFVQQDLNVLKSISAEALQYPEKIYCFLEKGDEVLDYRLAEKKYKLCKQKVISGGDHRFQNFERFLPEMLDFYQQALA